MRNGRGREGGKDGGATGELKTRAQILDGGGSARDDIVGRAIKDSTNGINEPDYFRESQI